MNVRTWILWLGSVVATTVSCGGDVPSGTPPSPAEATSAGAADVASALRAAYVATLQRDAAEDHRVTLDGGVVRAESGEQGLHAAFTAQGVTVTPAPGKGSWAYQLAPSRWGCPGRLSAVSPVAPEARDNRVEYAHPGLRAWYLNGPLGIEQGFTVERAPCAAASGGGVVIALEGGGDLRPEVSSAGDRASLRDARGDEVLRYTDLFAKDATGRPLGAALRTGPEGLSIHVDDAGAVYPIEVDPLVWVQQQKLTASDGLPGDQFGAALALSGDTVVIGAPASPGTVGQGSAYVFVRSGRVWTLQQKLVASDGMPGDLFGSSVAIDGDTIVLGAQGHASSQGAAYVFVRTGGVWTQVQELVASDGAPGDQFGVPVTLQGGTIVVGAIGRAQFQGAAYVFDLSGTVWTQVQELTASNGVAGDFFGGVALSGDNLIVTAEGVNNFQGAAYAFVRVGGVWFEVQEFAAPDGAQGDQFGLGVGIDGDTTIIGAPNHGTAFQGAAYVFVLDGGVWSLQQELTASNGAPLDSFGESAAIDGNTVVVGAIATVTVPRQGAAYVFVRSGSVWTQTQELVAGDPSVSAEFGDAVAIDGDTIVVGQPFHAPDATYVFTLVSCPPPVLVTTANLEPPHAFPGACDRTDPVGQAEAEGALAEMEGTCIAYCSQGDVACVGPALTPHVVATLECLPRDFGHRWSADCVCGVNPVGN